MLVEILVDAVSAENLTLSNVNKDACIVYQDSNVYYTLEDLRLMDCETDVQVNVIQVVRGNQQHHKENLIHEIAIEVVEITTAVDIHEADRLVEKIEEVSDYSILYIVNSKYRSME